MNNILVEKFEDHVLLAGDICYALYKRYPSGFRYFIGYFRAKYDYEAEVEWLEKHEKEPEPIDYVAKEVKSAGAYFSAIATIVLWVSSSFLEASRKLIFWRMSLNMMT
jgi:hypothetical protein